MKTATRRGAGSANHPGDGNGPAETRNDDMNTASPASARSISTHGSARLRRDLLAGASAMVIASCVAAIPALAQTGPSATWIGPDGGNWFTAANWSDGLVPAYPLPSQYQHYYGVSIDNGTGAVIAAPGAAFHTPGSYGLRIGGAPGTALTISGSGSLNVSGPYMRIGYAEGTEGTVTVRDGGTLRRQGLLNPNNFNAITLGEEGGIGHLEVLNGGLVYDFTNLSTQSAESSIKVSGNGSEIVANSNIVIYSGTLTVEDGGKVAGSAASIGSTSGSDGRAIVTGNGSELLTIGGTHRFNIGTAGKGNLLIAAGGKASTGQVRLGYGDGGNGTITVTGTNSALLAETGITIGAVTRTNLALDAGSGTVVVEHGGAVTVTGDTAIALGNRGPGVLTVADGGTVTASGISVASASDGDGTLNIGAAADEGARAAGTLDLRGGTIAFGEGAGRIVFNHTATDAAALDFGHALTGGTGSAAIDHIRGATIYGGDGSGFDGTTTVSGGTLLVTDRLGGAFDVSGGTLGGTGTIGTAGLTTTIGAGGTLSPGLVGQIETLDVAGNLTFAPGSTYAVHIDSSGQSDKVDVAGTATISNEANVRVSSLSGETFYTAGQTYDYTILSAGTLSGGFAAAPEFETLFLEGTVRNEGNDVVLGVKLKGSEPVEPADPNNPVWTGANGGDWFTAGNWDTGTVPDSTNYTGILTIANGGGPVVSQAGATAKGSRFDVGNAGGRGSLTVTGAGHLTSHNNFIDSGSGTASSVTVTDGGTWRLYELRSPQAPRASTLRVGDTGKGALTISAGGKVIDGSTVTVAAGAGSEGSVTVTGENSLLAASNITVSGGGKGTLTVLDKGNVTASSALQIGYANGGDATVRIDGDGSTVQASTIHVANSGGSGAVLVENGGKLVATAGAGNGVNIGYGGTGTGAVTLADGGTLQANRVTLGFFGGKGVLNIGAAEGQAARGAGVLDAPEIAFGAGFGTNDSTLVFNHDETGYEFSARLLRAVAPTDGSRAIRHLAGTTIYSGNSVDVAAGQYGFDGTTSVLGGTLLVTGKLGGTFDVSGTGVLGGTGTIGTAGLTTTIGAGGTLSPGLAGQIGTLNVAGDLTFASGSFYAVHVNSDRESDLVNVAGTATISSGANVRVNSLSGETFYAAGETYDYTILSAGTLSGAFNGSFESLFLEGTVQNDGNDVVLSVQRKVRDTNNPVWTGEGGGDWFEDDNWDTGIVPDSTNFTGTLTIASDGPVIDEAGATAYGTRFDVGKADGQGSLTITGAGHLTSHNSFIDSATDEASSVLVTDGGTWRLYELRSPQAPRASTLRIGDTGKGALMISAGGKVIDGSTVTVAAGAGSIGEVTVTGEGSLLAANALTVSGGGRGLLSVLDKGSVTLSNALQVGYANGGDGRVRIDGEGSTVQASTIHVANSGGNGAILVENGGKLVATATAGNGANIGYGPAGTGVLTLADGGTLQANRLTLGFFGGKGILNIGAAEGAGPRGAGLLDVPEIAFGSGFGTNDSTLVFNHTETDYVLNATFTKGVPSQTNGNRAIRHLAGTTTYGGNGSGFDGTTTVLGGTLLVTDRLSGAFDVSGTGVLGGTGTIGTAASGTEEAPVAGSLVTIASGGVLSPGLAGQIGTLNVAGDLVLEAGSTYAVHVNSDRESDKVDVAGTATVNGAAVRVTSLSGETFYEEGTTYDYTILSAGTLSGGFAGTPAFESLFLEGTVQNAGNDVVLAVNKKAEPQNPVTFEQFAETDNQLATARALDSLETLLAGRLMEVLLTEEQARETYDQLSGAQHASTQAALVQDSHFVRDAINDRIRDAFQDVAAPDLPVMAYGPDVRTPKDAPFDAALARSETFAVWASGFGSWGEIDGGAGIGDVDRTTGGVLIGADALMLDNWRLGLLAGYSRSSFDTATSEGASDSYHLGLYAGARWDALSLRSGVSYTWHGIETARSVVALGETLRADYDAGTLQAFGELGYRIDAGAAAFEPYANLAYVRLKTDGFTETGGLSALTVAGETVNATFTTLGVRVASSFGLGGVQAVARGGLGWRHAFGDVDPRSTHAFAGSDSFTVSGVPIAKNVAVLEAGLDLKVSPTAIFGLSYTGQFGSGARENGVNARFRVNF